MSNLRGVGRDGEDRAADFLIDKGYTIVTRRYTTKHGELDIVALDGEILVFVEVKQRRASGHIPEEGFGGKKSSRMARTILTYLESVGGNRQTRCDLIAIDAEGIRHYEGVF